MFGVAFEPSTLLDESAVPPPLPACHDPFPELTRSPLQANGREHPCGFPPSGWGRTCSGDQMVWLKTRVTLYHRVGQEGKSGWMPQGKRIWPEEVQRTSLYEDGIARMDGFLQLQSLHRGKKVRRTWDPMHMRLPCGIPWGRECAITAKRHPRISGWRLPLCAGRRISLTGPRYRSDRAVPPCARTMALVSIPRPRLDSTTRPACLPWHQARAIPPRR